MCEPRDELLHPAHPLRLGVRVSERRRVPPYDVVAVFEAAPLSPGEEGAEGRVAQRDGLGESRGVQPRI